jgi:hypothetical protein
LKETNGRHKSGTYLRFGEYGAWFGLHLELWKMFEISPLWFEFAGRDFGKPLKVRDLLRVWQHCSPRRCFDWEDAVVVPAILPTGVEKERIITTVVEQVGEIVALLNQLGGQKDLVAPPAATPPDTLPIMFEKTIKG